MVTAYLGIGSNLGDRLAQLRTARQKLRGAEGVASLASSALYETEPVGGPAEQGSYLNAALRIETTLTADQLLRLCLSIEADAGRERIVHHGPRTLDIDLLLYADLCRSGEHLTLPHPRLHERRFVLEPLCDLAPGTRHPLMDADMAELLSRLAEDGVTLLQKDW